MSSKVFATLIIYNMKFKHLLFSRVLIAEGKNIKDERTPGGRERDEERVLFDFWVGLLDGWLLMSMGRTCVREWVPVQWAVARARTTRARGSEGDNK